MTKTEKKIDKLICSALTIVCERAKLQDSGFSWLTHQVDFAKVSSSLVIRFMFDSPAALNRALVDRHKLIKLTEQVLNQHDIKLAQPNKQCRFEVEQNGCR